MRSTDAGRRRRDSAVRQAGGLAAAVAAIFLAAPGAAGQECGPAPADCGIFHLERGDYAAAVDALERALAASRDARTLNLLGIALTGAGRAEEGSERFRAALRLDAAFHAARRNLGVNEFTAGRHRDARRHFEEVVAHSPADEVAHVHLGEIHAARGDCTTALRHYERSGTRVLQRPPWLLHQAACLIESGRTADAVALLDRLPAEEAQARFEAGVALGRAGAHAEAARFFGSARARAGDPYAAAYNQTLMLVEAGEHGAAIRVAEELIAGGQAPAELHSLASRAYIGAGRIEEGYEALRAAIRLEPAVEDHYVDLALIAVDHENFDLGLEIVDIGLLVRPDSKALRLQRGVVLAMKGLVERAAEEFEMARRIAPGSPAPYFALALAWMTTGQAHRAVDVLRDRMREGPADAMLAYVFGLALMRSGVDPTDSGGAEAVQAFQTAVRLDPAMAGARAELGKLLLRRGDVEGALTQLERAVALEPDSPASLYQLAQAYRRTGQTARAKELLDRVTRLNVEERGNDPDGELRRTLIRIVRRPG